jgi:iron complex transport system permease protein
MDPNAFDTIQSVMFTNFNSIDVSILPACGLMVLAATLSIYFLHKELDVISLGENLSKSLGVDREEIIIYIIIMISVLVSVSTSLVGPIVFIGLFVSNLTRIMFNTYKHKFLLPASILIGVNLLLGGVYLNDLVFTDTNLPVVIDGLGALYFIYLCITKRSKIL